MRRILGSVLLLVALLLSVQAVSAEEVEIRARMKQEEEGVSISVTAAQGGTYHLIGAVYDEYGALRREGSAAVTLTADKAQKVVFRNMTHVTELTLFVLDDDFRPVCAAKTLTDDIIRLNSDAIDATRAEGVRVDGTVLTITEPGTYSLEGTLTDGRIVVADSLKKKDVTIELLGVDVSCTNSAPFNAGGGKVRLVLADGTENTFTDGGKYKVYETEKEPKGCFYGRRDLTIEGSGTLTVQGNVKNGLVCGADLEIGKGASVYVTAKDNAIKGNGNVKITKKAAAIYAEAHEGDALKTDAIEVDDNDETIRYIEEGKGTVTINGGTVTLIATAGDGIQADRSCIVKGGKVQITAGKEAIKANESSIPEAADFDGIGAATVFVSGAVEISGGEIAANAGEDGIKGAGNVAVSGGSVDITSVNDAFQSDGTLTVSGGTIVARSGGGHGVTIPDDADISAKGLKAETVLSVTGGDITVDAADDAIHSNYSVNITGGNMLLATGDDGIHAEYKLTMGTVDSGDDDFSVQITTCYEGLEGSVIEMLSGTTVLTASDDGINAAGDYTESGTLYTGTRQAPGGGPGGGPEENAPCGMLYLKGGMVYVQAEGDGIDSNGSIAMSGGIVVVDAPRNRDNGTFDYEERSGSFTVTGGMLVGIGPRAMTVSVNVQGPTYYESGRQGYGSSGGQAGKAVSFRVSGTTYTVVPTRAWSYLFISAAGLERNSISTSATAGATKILGYSKNGTFYGLCR